MRLRPFALMSLLTFCLMTLSVYASGPVPAIPATPDGTTRAVLESLANNQPGVIWAAMPASYQQDVNGIIQEFVGNVDAEVYNQGFAVIGKLGNVLKDKKQFFLASPMMQSGMLPAEGLEKSWDVLVDLLTTIASSDLGTVDKMKTMDVGAFLSTTGAKVMQQVNTLSTAMDMGPSMSEQLSAIQVSLVSQDGDRASISVSDGEEVTTEEMVRIEGRWVPADMASDWSSTMQSARSQLADMGQQENKPQQMAMLAAVNVGLDMVQNASTQQEFDQAMDQMTGMVMMLMMGGMGGMGGY